MSCSGRILLIGACLLSGSPRAGEEQPWREAMARVHARFSGRPGTFAQFGDSITVTLAFWAPLPEERRNTTPEMERAYQLVQERIQPECWREWKGPRFGSEGGKTIRWADENVADWLRELNPEVALILFGTNDLTDLTPEEYRAGLRSVVRRCLDNGTVVILSTIPPRHELEAKSARFAEVAREVAHELAVPLVDYHAEIRKRRPEDWDGASEAFRAFEGYDVPTLIARDGVHPSAPQRYRGDYSEEALRSHGYNLRNYLTLLAYAEVIEALDRPRPASVPGDQLPHQPWFPVAPPLPPPTGQVIRAGTIEEIHEAARRVKPGGTILLADGVYPVERTILITTDDVTLRGESGDRRRAVLDGGGTLGELLTIRACSGVTVADLTVRNVRWNGIKLDTDQNVQRVTIRNCILHNIWQRAVKGVKVPEANREEARPHDGIVEYCLFVNDRPKRFEDDPADTPENFGGNYIGGIDLMYPTGWTIRDNVFIGIRGRTGTARGAVFLWHDARDCVVERNIIIDCDSGICLGNSHKPPDVPVHCTNVVARNNFLCRVPENGILADFTRDCAILHNTVHDPSSRLGRLIRLVHDNDGLRVMNNLLSGPPPRIESESRVTLRGNVNGAFPTAFVAPEEGNLRLTAGAAAAIDRAVPVPDVTTDIDRNPRGPAPDVGAHELRSRD
jgi:lysophospholipase L1-like esterase